MEAKDGAVANLLEPNPSDGVASGAQPTTKDGVVPNLLEPNPSDGVSVASGAQLPQEPTTSPLTRVRVSVRGFGSR